MAQEISNRQIAISTVRSLALWLLVCAALMILTEATLRFFPPLAPKTHSLVDAAIFALAPLLARWLRRAP